MDAVYQGSRSWTPLGAGCLCISVTLHPDIFGAEKEKDLLQLECKLVTKGQLLRQRQGMASGSCNNIFTIFLKKYREHVQVHLAISSECFLHVFLNFRKSLTGDQSQPIFSLDLLFLQHVANANIWNHPCWVPWKWAKSKEAMWTLPVRFPS